MIQYRTKTVIVIFLIIISTVAIDTVWRINLENSARTQAKYNLAQIKLCVNDLLLTDKEGLYTNYGKKTRKKLKRVLYICAKNMKVSKQGDVWAYDLNTKEYVFDSNPKYGAVDGRYWKSDKICSKQGSWCSRLITIMNSGYDSTWMGYSWIFKHDKEWLEWKVLPDEYLGFDGGSKSGEDKTQQVVVVQGARESELLHRYRIFRTFLYSLGFVMIVINLLLDINTPKYGRRSEDI